LRALHRRVLAEADAVCRQDSGAGLTLRGVRQRAIVAALCAGEKPCETAARLGLSRRHYYRERQEICTRVSHALMRATPNGTQFNVDDALRLQFARAEALVDQGLAQKAACLLEGISSASERDVRGAATVELAGALITLGATTRATDLLATAESPPWYRDRLILTEARLAMATGDDAKAGRALEKLAKRRIGNRQLDETTLEAIVACGSWYCGFARFRDGRAMLGHARDVSRQLPRLSARHQIGVALLAADCAEDSGDGFDMERYWLDKALTLSVANGSAEGALGAISSLIFHHVSIGSDDAAFKLTEQALAIARATEGTRLLETTGIQIVVMLMQTRHWRAVDPLLFELEKYARPHTFSWGLLKQAQGSFLSRTARYRQAQAALSQAYAFARSVKNRKLEGVVLRELAIVLHHLRCRKQSIEFIREAVGIAEEHGSAYTLRFTYEAAAHLLPDRRIARLAHQVKAEASNRLNALRASDCSPSVSVPVHHRLTLGQGASNYSIDNRI
jgi:tetratricopeptide (TPR) repeat protein